MVGQKKRYKSTREVIEQFPFPEYEHRLMKYPGLEVKDITDYSQLDRDSSAQADPVKKKQYLQLGNGKRYSLIHNHGSKFKPNIWENIFDVLTLGYFLNDVRQIKHSSAIHGGTDMRAFLFNPSWKSMPIAVTNLKTGELLGYNVLKKTRNTPKPSVDPDFASEKELNEGISNWEYSEGILKDADKYDDIRMTAMSQHNPAHIRKIYDQFLNKYHLKSRFVPAKDYQVNKFGTAFEKRKNLEAKVAAVATSIFLVSSILFLSSNLTGNVIGISKTSSNLIGGILFIFGLIGAFFYFKNKR